MKRKKKNPPSVRRKKPVERYAGVGVPTDPSDIAFWLDWPPGDEAWAWFDAIATTDTKDDPTLLIQLLAKRVPERAMPFVKDLLNRKLGKEKSKPGRKMLLWKPPALEALSIRVGRLIENKGLSVEEAVEQIIKEHSWLCSSLGVTLDKPDKLITHYTAKSGYARRWEKKGRS
jgi:hypothetical protein